MAIYKKLLVYLSFFVVLNTVCASNDSTLINIKGKITNLQSTRLYAAIEGNESRIIIDSTNVINGNFSFSFYRETSSSGFVYIIGNKEVFFHQLIIFVDNKNNSNIQLSSNGDHFVDSIQFDNNPANQLLYDFFRANKDYGYKLNFIKSHNKEYIYKDEYIKLNIRLYERTLKAYQNQVLSLIKKVDKIDISKILSSYFSLQKDFILNYVNENNDYATIHSYLRKINSNIGLLNTDALEPVFGEFMSRTFNDSIPQIHMERVLKDSFYSLIAFQKSEPQLIAKLGGYYKNALVKLEYYNALDDYLSKYGTAKSTVSKTVLKAGEEAKGIRGFTKEGILVDINDFKADYKIIYIWSPECGHCQKLVPEMNGLYQKVDKKRMAFYSFSVLKLDSAYKNGFAWNKSVSLYKGWENDFLIKYAINYTPVILLVNKDNAIIEIPFDVDKLTLVLSKLGLLVN